MFYKAPTSILAFRERDVVQFCTQQKLDDGLTNNANNIANLVKYVMKSTNGDLISFKFYLTGVIVIEISGAFSLDGTEKKLKVDLHEILHDKQTTKNT